MIAYMPPSLEAVGVVGSAFAIALFHDSLVGAGLGLFQLTL